MEIKIEHKTTVTLFEKTFEMTNNEFKDFLKACRALLEREGCITDEPTIRISKDGLEAFKPGLTIPVSHPYLNVEQEIIDNREFLLTKSPHKAIAEVVKGGLESKPIDTNAVKDRVEKMIKPGKLDPYIKMHEEGKPMEAIKNQMLADNFCLQGSLSYHVKKVLSASNRVTKIELESAVETAEQTIERLKAENLANTEKRKKPKIAMK